MAELAGKARPEVKGRTVPSRDGAVPASAAQAKVGSASLWRATRRVGGAGEQDTK